MTSADDAITLLLPVFNQFAEEGKYIGRMLAGYGELEVELMFCAEAALQDSDIPLKAMFRPRGETQRIQIGDALARQTFKKHDIETPFSMAVGGMKYCLQIRNQYAHCHWYGEHQGKLTFVDLQAASDSNERVSRNFLLTGKQVDVDLLKAQLMYFLWTSALFSYARHQLLEKLGKLLPQNNPHPKAPKEPKRPDLHIP